MKKLYILLSACLFSFPSFATESKSNIETSLKSDDTDKPKFFFKLGVTRPKITYNFADSVKDSEKYKTLSFDTSIGMQLTDKIDAAVTVKTFKDIIDTNTIVTAGNTTKTKKTLSNTLLLTDGYFNIINIDKSFKPYLSIGMGIAAISTNTATSVNNSPATNNKNSNISFAYSAGIGFNTPIWKSVFFDMNFKYYNLGKLRKENISIETNSFSMGIKVAI